MATTAVSQCFKFEEKSKKLVGLREHFDSKSRVLSNFMLGNATFAMKFNVRLTFCSNFNKAFMTIILIILSTFLTLGSRLGVISQQTPNS